MKFHAVIFASAVIFGFLMAALISSFGFQVAPYATLEIILPNTQCKTCYHFSLLEEGRSLGAEPYSYSISFGDGSLNGSGLSEAGYFQWGHTYSLPCGAVLTITGVIEAASGERVSTNLKLDICSLPLSTSTLSTTAVTASTSDSDINLDITLPNTLCETCYHFTLSDGDNHLGAGPYTYSISFGDGSTNGTGLSQANFFQWGHTYSLSCGDTVTVVGLIRAASGKSISTSAILEICSLPTTVNLSLSGTISTSTTTASVSIPLTLTTTTTNSVSGGPAFRRYTTSSAVNSSQWLIFKIASDPVQVIASNSGILPQYSSEAALNQTIIGQQCAVKVDEECTNFKYISQTGWFFDSTNNVLIIHYVGGSMVTITIES